MFWWIIFWHFFIRTIGEKLRFKKKNQQSAKKTWGFSLHIFHFGVIMDLVTTFVYWNPAIITPNCSFYDGSAISKQNKGVKTAYVVYQYS